VKDTYEYWLKLFVDLNANIFEDSNTPAMELGHETPDDKMRNLSFLQKRNNLTTLEDEKRMVSMSGCLVSLKEIARSISPMETEDSLLESVQAFKTAASSLDSAAVDREKVKHGIIAVRELFDVCRRYSFCSKLSDEYEVPFEELLALYRQEGALAVTPPKDSFKFGPLIRTGTICRRDEVTLFANDDPDAANWQSASRPGFDLVYLFNVATDAIPSRVESCKVDLLVRNLLVVGGLDTIVQPRLPSQDELVQFMRMAGIGGKRSSPSEAVQKIKLTYRNKLAGVKRRLDKTQQQLLDELCIGLVMAEIEQRPELPKAEELLDLLWLRISSLIDSYDYEPKPPRDGADIHLLGDWTSTDTYLCLQVQAQWYASRQIPSTLVSRSDRSGKINDLGQFSPFLSYLRFHAGDVIFLGILLRTMTNLDQLDARWKKDKLGQDFHDKLTASSWSGSPFPQLKNSLNDYWTKVPINDAWRHIGLIEAIKARGDIPSWLKDAEKCDPRHATIKEVARQTIEAIADNDLLPALTCVLEFTPVSTLRDLRIVPEVKYPNMPDPAERKKAEEEAPRRSLVNAHSFERMRIVYASSLAKAGLD